MSQKLRVLPQNFNVFVFVQSCVGPVDLST